jgi:rhomboid family GlyGly-CTERM serine protease
VAPRLRLIPPWLAACAGLSLVSALVFLHDAGRAPGQAWAGLLEWRAERIWSEPWRLLTAAFVHYGWQHLAYNLAGGAVVALFGWAGRLPGRFALALALAWPLTHALLLAAPGLARYGGLSGVLHAAVAVAAVALMLQGGRRQRAVGAAVWAGLLVKVLLEQPWAGAVQTMPGWDIPVAVAAHAAGLASGTLAGLLAAGLAAAPNASATRRAARHQRDNEANRPPASPLTQEPPP